MAHSVLDRIKAAGIPHAKVAEALGRSQPVATRLLSGERALKADEIPKLEALLTAYSLKGSGAVLTGARRNPVLEMFEGADTLDSVPVDILPTYAGLGGGGTGDGEVERILVPRYLVEGLLRGSGKDFLYVRVRGDSMEPDFHHDDELLVDRRDTSPAQPGPFALWHEDEYVVKNVEKTLDGQVRIFSSNPKYSSIETAREETRVIGRPVWIGRRL